MNVNTAKENFIKSLHRSITRVKLTSAGFIVEINEAGLSKDEINDLFRMISSSAWDNQKEIVYSFYGFSNNEQRFGIDGTLREKPTDHDFNMATSYLGTNDVFGRFTRFDFDAITLADRDEETIGLFVIEDFSPCKEPLIVYNELDIQGHQFSIHAKPEMVASLPGVYSIKLVGGDHRS